MSHTVRTVEYFHTTIRNRTGEAYVFLASLADAGVNLLAFSAAPVGATSGHMTLFPEDPDALVTSLVETNRRASLPATIG